MSVMGMTQQKKNVQALKSLPVLMQYMGKFSEYKLHAILLYIFYPNVWAYHKICQEISLRVIMNSQERYIISFLICEQDKKIVICSIILF